MISSDGRGIALEGRNGLVQENTVTFNGAAGIQLTDISNHVIDNNVSQNTGDGIDALAGGQSQIRGNTVNNNQGIGIAMVDPDDVDAIFSENIVLDNAAGTTIGGNNEGGNICHVPGSSLTTCP